MQKVDNLTDAQLLQNPESAPSAFAAAEFKVRKSQIQMFSANAIPGESFNQVDPETTQSIDIVAPDINFGRALESQTQGPPIVVPTLNNVVDEVINEVQLT